ncbi:MAG: site-2 protease family protein, partial [Rivularia sp. ALOHA_DT_140]|nr:site-2 protease family protein [Rivularia sp. ALOHA_DT_140]
MSVLAAIAVLAVLIFVHELGHFIAARSQGIHVNRFSLGFGPVLLKYQGSETEYAVRAFPLGGFVGFPDDDPDSTIEPDDPNLLRNRPILD